MIETPSTSELFAGADYEVTFPKVDGRDVDAFILRLSGSIKLNRNDPDHAAFMDRDLSQVDYV